MMVNAQLSSEQLEAIRKSSQVRRELAFGSHLMFFSIYLPHYIKYPFAPMHFKMFETSEDQSTKFAVITAFRDSGKSTVNTLSYPIWAVVGKLQKKFVLIVSQTQVQAKYHLLNIRRELEGNDLLKNDIGPFHEEEDEWGSTTIVLSNYDARITIASTEQSIRGIRHGAHRPDLIICDDVEDLNSVKTKEGRDKTWNWFTGEVLPLGSKETKYIVVGNLLHEDSLIMRLKKVIEEGKLAAKYFEFPLLDENNNIAWPGKFSTITDIGKLKATIPSDTAWFREYLLKIISDDERIVKKEWIKKYDNLPDKNTSLPRILGIAVDPAISGKETSDPTALVPFALYGYGENLKLYVLPYIVNKRMKFPETVEEIKKLVAILRADFKMIPTVYVESVGFQEVLSQYLLTQNILSEPVKISNMDKETRLNLSAPYIRMGQVLFPQAGADDMLDQITNFGIEKYDDLVDAFAIAMIKVINTDFPSYKSQGETIVVEDSQYRYCPATGEWMDVSKPILDGLLEKIF